MRRQLLVRAQRLRDRWGCGQDSPALPADRKAFAEAWARAFRLPTPPSCPFADLQAGDPLVGRTCEGMLLLEAGMPSTDAFPGGVSAVDREAVGIVLAMRARCTGLELPESRKDDDDGS